MARWAITTLGLCLGLVGHEICSQKLLSPCLTSNNDFRASKGQLSGTGWIIFGNSFGCTCKLSETGNPTTLYCG